MYNFRKGFLPIIFLLTTVIFPFSDVCGLEPEELLLVVNPRSTISMELANYYAFTRQLPPENVFYLDYDDAKHEVSWTEFYENIFKPISFQAKKRNCLAVAFSCGFPLSVNLSNVFDDFGVDEYDKKILTPTGSLNGMMYLGRLIQQQSDKPHLSLLKRNYYIFPEGTPQTDAQNDIISQPVIPFDNTHAQNHLLCCFLGRITDQFASENCMNYLRRSISADGTFPKGTVYFVANNDIRTQVRQHEFWRSVENIEYLSSQNKRITVAAEIINCGCLPVGKKDIVGLTTGCKQFDWAKSGCAAIPGAICENLTSYGGMLYKNHNQTSMLNFLDDGAAGTSGTPTEPYAIAEKFPSCELYRQYISGLTLIESYYRTVRWPYQLVIVGDPLCCPWKEKKTVVLPNQKQGKTMAIKRITPAPIEELYMGQTVLFELSNAPAEIASVQLISGNRILNEAVIQNDSPVTLELETLKLGVGQVIVIARFNDENGNQAGSSRIELQIRSISQKK